MGHTYGYLLNIEDSGDAEAHAEAMRRAGAAVEIVVEEKGKNESRPRWERLFRRLRGGDTLVLENIYGLGFNFNTVADTLRKIEEIGNVCLVFLDMPLMSERSASDPLRPMVSELVSQTVLYLVEHQKRTRESQQRRGFDSAKSRGVQLGRPKMELPDEYAATVRRWRNGEITAAEASELMNISRTTFFRRVKNQK